MTAREDFILTVATACVRATRDATRRAQHHAGWASAITILTAMAWHGRPSIT